MRIKIRSFLPGIVGFIIATTLFCLPGKEFPKQDWFDMIFLDKWIHVGLFAGLVSLWCLPFIYRIEDPVKLRSLFLWITGVFILYGIIIEFIQGRFIPFRTFGIDDMVADTLGCGIGYLFSKWQLKKQNFNANP